MDIGGRLKRIRLKRNMKLAEVAELINKTEATIQRYESGNIKTLKLDVIEDLARIYDVPPAYLMGWQTETPLSFNSSYNYYNVSVSAGLPTSVDGITNDNVEKITLPDIAMGKWAGCEDIFLVKANGESMNKLFPNHSLLAVKPIEIHRLKSNDIVVFSNGGNEYSVKRFIKDPLSNKIIFRPESTDVSYTDYVVDEDYLDSIRIHGKVVLYIANLD